MKTLLSAFFILIGFNNLSFCQLPGVIVNAKYGGSGADEFTGITQLTNGNYVVGGDESSTDYQCVGNHGAEDFFLTCVSPKGQLLWQKVIGGSNPDGGSYNINTSKVKNAADGGFFFGGATQSNDGDISGNHGGWDAFIMKCDADGNIKWKKLYGGNNYEYFGDMQSTADGGCIFAAGSSSGSNGDVPTNHSPGSSDVWIVKLDSLGNIQWSKMYGGTGTDNPTSLKVTPDGYIFAADTNSPDGDVAGSVFNGVTGGADEWVVKLDRAGNIVWKDRFGGSADDNDGRLCVGSDGNYTMLCSSRSGDGDFGLNYGLYDMAVIRLAGDGTVIWKKIIGGTAWDTGNDIIETPDGNLEIVGLTYSGKINGIPITMWGTAASIILCKLNKNTSDFIWITSVGGSGFDKAEELLVNEHSDVVMTGTTSSSDFDFPVPGFGGRDGFITVLAQLNSVSGHVFNDINSNGVKDANELYMDKVQVTTAKSNGRGGASYTYKGVYYNEVDSGTYTTRPKLFKPGYFIVKPDSIVTTFPGYYGGASQDFGIKSIPGKQDISVKIIPVTAARVGSTCTYYMICYNTATDTVQNGSITFTIDPGLQLLSAFPAQANLVGNTLSWQYNNFKPFDTLVYKLTFDVRGVPGKYDHYISNSTATIFPIINDLVPADNADTLRQPLIASFDPNEKDENHADTITTLQVSNQDYLTYTIRFQNTGTDTAFNVLVLDTLGNKVDLNSFQMLYSSNDYKLKIINSNILQWTFPNILLPDSNVNKSASHGFISYVIKPLKTLVPGDIINNTSSIYFDYNDPVQTNVSNTLVIGNNSTLPLVIESFTARIDADKNVLNWILSENITNGDFYVQRSIDGTIFTIIAKVKVNSSTITSSNLYTDENPYDGLNFYRIKLETVAGNVFYSEVRKLDNSKNLRTTFLYPNPAVKKITIKGIPPDAIVIDLIASSGSLIKTLAPSTNDTIEVDVSQLPPGEYFLSIRQRNGNTITKKMIVH
jgi:uncharacterized repeat protein (TIGR01451 family)